MELIKLLMVCRLWDTAAQFVVKCFLPTIAKEEQRLSKVLLEHTSTIGIRQFPKGHVKDLF